MARKQKAFNVANPFKLYSKTPNKRNEFPLVSAYPVAYCHQFVVKALTLSGTDLEAYLTSARDTTAPKTASTIRFNRAALDVAMADAAGMLKKTAWLSAVSSFYWIGTGKKETLSPTDITALVNGRHVPCPDHLIDSFDVVDFPADDESDEGDEGDEGDNA